MFYNLEIILFYGWIFGVIPMPNLTTQGDLNSKKSLIQSIKMHFQLGYPWLILILATLLHIDHSISFVAYCRKSPQQLTNILSVFMLTIFTSVHNSSTRFHVIRNRVKVQSILKRCNEFYGDFKYPRKFLTVLTWAFFCFGNFRHVITFLIIYEQSMLNVYLTSESIGAKIMPPEIPILFVHITILTSLAFGLCFVSLLGLQLQNVYAKVRNSKQLRFLKCISHNIA